MPILGRGWELLVTRARQERRAEDWRTIGTYQVFRDGTPVAALTGTTVETGGPGDNGTMGNLRRIEARRYPLRTHLGETYASAGYSALTDPDAIPRPALGLGATRARVAILIHPGLGFLRSRGCIHPTHALSGPDDDIDYSDSRARTIALISDLSRYIRAVLPARNRVPIPNAWIAIEGEP